MIVRKPSSHFTDSSTTSSYCSSVTTPPSVLTDEWDADDEHAMSVEDFQPSKSLSVAIPNVGPYCPRRPNLREILANTSPAPWTLAAFMAYLSTNHCLETLEFTMDAGRYRKHYVKMMSRASSDGVPPVKDRQYVQDLWTRLVDAYIRPNGSREVNLPSDVRDLILNFPSSSLPPPPENLDMAVAKIYELMEDSVLVPFLNTAYPQPAHPTMSSAPSIISSDGASTHSYRMHNNSPNTYMQRGQNVRSSETTQSAVESHGQSYPAPTTGFRRSAPTTLSHTLSKPRFNARLTTSTSSPAAPLSRSSIAEVGDTITQSETSPYPSRIERMPAMTDDSGSGSTYSPTTDSPSTPPMSPPLKRDSSSPKRDSGMWKKLGRLSGMKVGKKKSLSGLRTTEE